MTLNAGNGDTDLVAKLERFLNRRLLWLLAIAIILSTPMLKVHYHAFWGPINWNITAIDLLNNAIAHDQSGQFKQGTEDFRGCLDSPSFSLLIPVKLQIALHDLLDSREQVEDKDYFCQLICHSGIGYWPTERMPLRIYVPDNSTADGFSAIDREQIADCFNQWCALAPKQVQYKFVDSEKEADISFGQKRLTTELGFSRTVLAHTRPVTDGPSTWGVSRICKAKIEVMQLTPEITSREDSRLPLRHGILLHEIGHSLGLLGHSCNAHDILFFQAVCKHLTDRDKRTFQCLYGTSTTSIYDRAEKTLRERAAGGDKYACLQLAYSLQQDGTATEREWKESFRMAKKAADQGLPQAQRLLGGIYQDGDGVKANYPMAIKYYQLALKQNLGSAYLSLANLYEHGDGVKQDLKRAESYIKYALNYDLNSATTAYAELLSYHKGDDESLAKAAKFYTRAVGFDVGKAMVRLAAFYDGGFGVDRNPTMAKQLREQAQQYILLERPTDARGFFARGYDWLSIDRPKEAINDFSKALQLKPNFREGLLRRGQCYLQCAQYQNAYNDLERALQLDPYHESTYFTRIYVDLCLFQPRKCLEDIQHLLKVSQDPDSNRVYAYMGGYLAALMLKDTELAQSMLHNAALRVSSESWPGPIVHYLQGEISEPALLASAGHGDQRATEARAYAGIKHALINNHTQAILDLRWVAQHGDPSFYEYPMALNFLNVCEKSELNPRVGSTASKQ